MIRLLFLIILAFLSIAEIKTSLSDKSKKIMFITSLSVYFVFLSLRYAQGTDFLSFAFHYYREIDIVSFLQGEAPRYYVDFGYTLLVMIFRQMNANFSILVAFVNLINILLLYKFINYFAKHKMLTLTLFYGIYGLVFLESTLRQSLAITIILGLFLPLLAEKRKVFSFLAIALAAWFHLSAWICLLVWIVEDERITNFIKNKNKIFVTGLLMSFLMINFFPLEWFGIFLPNMFYHRLEFYMTGNSFSLIGIIRRLSVLLVVIYLIFKHRGFGFVTAKEEVLLKSLLLGLCFYFIFMRIDIISRVTTFAEIGQVAVLPQILLKHNKYLIERLMAISYFLLSVALYFNANIATLRQLPYRNNVILVPYITIFERERLGETIELEKLTNVDFLSHRIMKGDLSIRDLNRCIRTNQGQLWRCRHEKTESNDRDRNETRDY